MKFDCATVIIYKHCFVMINNIENKRSSERVGWNTSFTPAAMCLFKRVQYFHLFPITCAFTHCMACEKRLTVFPIVEYFHVFLFGGSERFNNILRCTFVRFKSAQKIATTMSLNQLRPAVARQSTKPVVAVDDRKVWHLCISQNEVTVGWEWNYSKAGEHLFRTQGYGESCEA